MSKDATTMPTDGAHHAHAAPPRRTRRWRRALATALGLLACLVLVGLVNATVREDQSRARWYVGQAQAPVTSPRMDVEVQDVLLAREVSTGLTPLTTEETFVVVLWSTTAHEERIGYTASQVQLATADGARVSQRNEVSQQLPVDPGFTGQGVSVFEVPTDRVEGADLEIHDREGLYTYYNGALRVTDVVDAGTPRQDVVDLPAPTVEVTR